MTDWTHVQGVSSATVGATSISLSAVGSGHVVVGGVVIDPGLLLTKVTDNQSNVYDIVAADDNAVHAAGFKSRGLITNGPTSLTLTYSGTPGTYTKIAVDEFAPPTGCSAISLDGTMPFVYLGATGSNTTSSAAFTNLNNDVLLWGFGWEGNGSAPGAGSGFTLGVNDTTDAIFSEYRIQATPSNANVITWAANTGDIFGVGFGIAPVSQTLWTPVQRNFLLPGSATLAQALSLPNPMTPGNIFVGGIAIDSSGGSGNLTTITDNLGNHYESFVPQNDLDHYIFWSGGQVSGAPQTFTVHSGTSFAIGFSITEIAPPKNTGSVVLDGSVQNSYFTTPAITTLSSGNITTTAADDLLYSFMSPGGTQGSIPQNGWNNLNALYQFNTDAYFIQTAAGAIGATWDFVASEGIIMFAMALKAIAQSGISTSPQIGGCRIGTIGAL